MNCPRCSSPCRGIVSKYHEKYIELFTCKCGNLWSRELTAEDMKILHELRKVK